MGRRGWIALGMALAPGIAQASGSCEAHSNAATIPLLELYTSEGCSSCPPADRWFSSLLATPQGSDLNLLAFHVDYWDGLGWRDRFAQKAFSLRQRNRVRVGGSSTVYTPQLMLSSRLRLNWNQPSTVLEAIRTDAAQPARAQLGLRARPGSGAWRVELGAAANPAVGNGAQLYLALYEDALVSQVSTGENAGDTLRHDRVVRGLWGPWPLALRRLDVQPPQSGNPKRMGLTAFVQDAQGQTLQSLALPLVDCPASN
ncbi:MAG: DUF1223 domain-containing protein [Arenimonas sp.]